MTFRSRLVLAAVVIAVVPLAVLAIGVQREVERRLALDFSAGVVLTMANVEASFARERERVASRLRALGRALAEDNRFRREVSGAGSGDRRYVLDYAGEAMALTGLDALRVQEADGRVLSSGHFRNEFDTVDSVLAGLRAEARGAALVRVRTAEGSRLVLAGVDSVRYGARYAFLTGGIAVDAALLAGLAGGEPIAVRLEFPGGSLGDTLPSAGDPEWSALRREVRFPHVAEDGVVGEAVVRIAHSREPLDAVRERIRAWLVLAAAATIGGAALLAWWVAARLSTPLVELARQTAVLDLDRLDVDFATGRRDEVGQLARLLDGLATRLRASAGRLRDAERRATVADLARQVNHDIKNAVVPIRNVFRHLEQVARDEPHRLAEVFGERHETVASSIGYLHDLAANYARLSPRLDRAPCDVNAVLREIAGEHPAGVIDLQLADAIPRAAGDRVALRRICENVIGNAVESLGTGGGTVTVSSTGGPGGVRVTIADTGAGMTERELEQAFDDFYTTKDRGTGLGLSVVRRLIADLGGSYRVRTEPGRGTTFALDMPAADPSDVPPSRRPEP